VSFDRYRDSYRDEVQHAIRFAGRDLDVFTKAKADELIALARRRLGDLTHVSALDVGCGVGETDRELAGAFGVLHGVDVSAALLERAAESNPTVTYTEASATNLPYEDAVFDLAFAVCVMHHIEPPARDRALAELARVTRAGGCVALIEHNPLNPLTRLVVARCAFDHDAVLLTAREARALAAGAGLRAAETRHFLVFPWRARPLLAIERGLAALPLGAQYVVAATKATSARYPGAS
jgi:SAM-dependent methyltransferase